MIVRILQEIEYEPTADDDPRCWGQLRVKPSRIPVEVEARRFGEDGRTVEAFATKIFRDGPMVRYFRRGATPNLKPEIAERFVADGIAEPLDLDVVWITKEAALADVARVN